MTRRQRRLLACLSASTTLAMVSALTSGPLSVAFALGAVTVLLARIAWRRVRTCWREGI